MQLDGITVVSGVNGCGKSTMSKLLYYIFRNAIHLKNWSCFIQIVRFVLI